MTKFVVDNGKNLIQAYDAAETDALLNQKANAADVYNKTEVDAKDYDLEQRIAAVDNKFADYYPQFAIDLMLDGKANTSGEYDDLTVGHAKQLTSRVGETDKTPYNFRTSGGSLDIGDLETDKIIGGSVAFNQQAKNGNFADGTNDWNAAASTLSANNNELTVTIGAGAWNHDARQTRDTIANHVYFSSFDVRSATLTDFRIVFCQFQSNAVDAEFGKSNNLTSSFANVSTIVKTQNGAPTIRFSLDRSSGASDEHAGESYIVRNVVLIDLTQMFGATIADYIYSLESANAGAGVAWFKKLFPKSYYSYNAGQIMSVKTSKHVTVGFNAWDEEWKVDGTYFWSKNPIPVIPDTDYYIKTPVSANFNNVDENGNYISYIGYKGNQIVHIPANCHFVKFQISQSEYGSEYNNDICFNISWDGERNGEYEPYVANEYYLQNDLELRGIFKLDANNKLYADGDEYPDSGDVTRKYGVVDLGSLNWGAGFGGFYTAGLVGNIKLVDSSTIPNMICGKKYSVVKYSEKVDKTISIIWGGVDNPYNNYINILDADYSDAAAFKTAMSGVYLVYELATPTSELVNGYTNPQKVNDFGTEQYVDGREVEIPVGHETFYQANLKAKLEMSPDSPDADGLYLMQHNNGENVYTPYISPIPALPSTDGTFVLKCTVSGTTKTLTWVEET